MKKLCTHCGKEIARKVHPNTKQPFCNTLCYGEWQRGKSFAIQDKAERPKKVCCVDGCGAVHFGRGYCRKHYISLHYAPPQNPPKERREPRLCRCLHCGVDFVARHESPKFCSIACASAARKKPFILKKGYKKLLIPSHPRADKKGYVFEHIVVMEAIIGRPLSRGEEIHHKDFNRQNNAPDNLQLCASHAEHMKYHARPL